MLNETNWNKFDDKFYLVNRRWFDRWKDYVSYDYIVKCLVEQGLTEADLSLNRVLQNNSNPGEITNSQLLSDFRKDFLKNRGDKMHFCNISLRRDIVPDRDLIFVSEPIWRFLYERYRG